MVLITIWISGQERQGIDEGWIARTIEGLRREGSEICVRVHVVGPGIDVGLSAGSCPPSTGAQRRARADEQQILNAWEACGLRGELNPGRVIQCLKRVERAI